MSDLQSLPDTPKAALEVFLLKLTQDYYSFYDKQVIWHRRIWHPLHWSGILIGASTAVVAALATEASFMSFGQVRVLLIILPIVGAFLSTVLVQSQLSQRFQLRENGRRKVQHLLNEGRRLYAKAQKDEDYSATHADLVKKINAIEEEQGSGFFAFVLPVRDAESAQSNTR